MKINQKFLGAICCFLPLLVIGFLLTTKQVSASTLTLQNSGNGDDVQVTVTGTANSSVLFYYLSPNLGLQLKSLGTTNSSGNFSTTLSTGVIGVASSSPVYVKVGGVTASPSASVEWPYVAVSSVLTLSSTGLSLAVGQSSVITAYNGGSNLLYLSNNSNPAIANININGSQLTVLGMITGQTSITVCTQGSVTSCASAYVTVTSAGTASLTFSQNSATIAFGQNLAINVSGGTGVYTILNNSNSGAISTSISGSVVTLSAIASSGSAAVTVCTTNMAACGVINVTAGSVNSSAIAFSQTSPILAVGQSLNITMSGATNNTYNISTNSNSSAVAATISGNSLYLVGLNIGTATISVCGVSANCSLITATVGYSSNGGKLTLSQSTLSLIAGQSLGVIISGGTSPYNLGTYTSSSIFSASLSNNILTVTGNSAGSANLDICSAGGACVSMSIYVNGVTSSANLSLSKNSLAVAIGNNDIVTLSGNGGYSILSNSNGNVATASISGSNVIVYGVTVGSSNITVCQTGGQCGVILVNVTASAVNQVGATVVDAGVAGLAVSVSGSAGEIVKVNAANRPAIYYVTGGKKYLFVNRVTYTSWSQAAGDVGNNFSTLKTLSQLEFDAIPLGGNLVAKPGTLVQFEDSSNVYGVGSGGKLYKLADSSAQKALYGSVTPNIIQSGFRSDYYNFGNAVSTLTTSSQKPN